MNKYSKKYLDKISSSKVYDVVIKSPITKAESVSSQFNNKIYLKREDLQPTRSFKIRGAYNKISNLVEIKNLSYVNIVSFELILIIVVIIGFILFRILKNIKSNK